MKDIFLVIGIVVLFVAGYYFAPSENIRTLVVTFGAVLMLLGGLWLAFYKKLRNLVDRFDSDNQGIKQGQRFLIKWGEILLFLVLGLPLVNIFVLFLYVIKREVSNHEVIVLSYWHILDMVIYGWKVVFWHLPASAILWVARFAGAPGEMIKNSIESSWFFAWYVSFIGAVFVWTWIKADNTWNFFLRWIVYIMSVLLLTVFMGEYLFTTSIRPLPTSDAIEYVWGKVASQNATLNTAEGAQAPTEYSTSTTDLSSADEAVGIDMMTWIYIGAGIALLLVIFYFLWKKRKGKAGAPQATTATTGAPGAAAQQGGGETKQESKKYDRNDYAVDLELMRRYVALFERFVTTPFYCHNVERYQLMIDRMRKFLRENTNLRTDSFFAEDHIEIIEALQQLISVNAYDKIPFGEVKTAVENETYSFWAMAVSQIMSAASQGFVLLPGEYGGVTNALYLYANNITNILNATIPNIPVGNKDKNDPHLLLCDGYRKQLATIENYFKELHSIYGKIYGGQLQNMPGVNQVPTGPSWISVQYENNPKGFRIGAGVFALILVAIFLWFRFGPKEMSEEERNDLKVELRAAVAEAAGLICTGTHPDSLPPDLKERVRFLAGELNVSLERVKEEVTKKTANCPGKGKKQKKGGKK